MVMVGFIMEKSLTVGSESKLILLFSLPLLFSQFLQVSYSMVDAIIVGNYVGSASLGAVSVSGTLLWISNAAAMGLGTGTNILLAQYFGARKTRNIQQALITITIFCLIIGLLFSFIIAFTCDSILLQLLHIPMEMFEEAKAYLMVSAFGVVFQILYQVFYGACRSFGDSTSSLIFLMVAALMNLVLDLLFVPYLHLGVLGAAYASVMSQIAACIAALLYLHRHFSFAFPGKGEGLFHIQQLSSFLKFSLPISTQLVVQSSGFLLLQRLVNSFGPASIEGFAVMDRTECFIHIPALSIATAISSFVGQNVGARQYQRVEKGIRFSLIISLAISVVIGTLMFLFAEPVLRIYNISGDALLRGREHLRIMCVLLPVYTVSQIVNGALQGAGDVTIPVISTFTDLALRLTFAYIMAQTLIGFRSIYLSSPPAWIIACAISVIRYRKGIWKKKQIPQGRSQRHAHV